MASVVLSMDHRHEEDALIILRETIGFIGDESVDRYHLCSGLIHKYGTCRADLTAMIAITLIRHVHLRGRKILDPLASYCAGKRFPVSINDLRMPKRGLLFWRKSVPSWEPDSWVYQPEHYVADLSEGNFGRRIAVDRWLYYHEQGLMETKYLRNDAADAFRKLLEQY